MSIGSAVRARLRPWRCLIYETRNRLTTLPATRRNAQRQEAEVARLRSAIGHPIRAKVLVVIPTFRRPDGLRRAVASALAQTFDELAVIVVDDGGGLPDDLPEDPRLTEVSLSGNTATLGLVRNVGCALGESEYIAFLDDDNTWTPDHLTAAVRALDGDRSLSGVYTMVRRRHPDGTELDLLGAPYDRKRLRWQPYIDANSIVVRRSAHRGFSVLPRSRDTLPKEDWEYVWRTSRRKPMALVPEVTVEYTVNPDSYFTDWDAPADSPMPQIADSTNGEAQ